MLDLWCSMTNRRYEVYEARHPVANQSGQWCLGPFSHTRLSSIPDDLVEEAAKRMWHTYAALALSLSEPSWDEVSKFNQEQWIREARAALGVLFGEEE